MKKVLVIIGLFITFLIIYFLQSNFFGWFNIAGVKPNLFIILVLFISLFAGIKVGISYSLFFGLFLDVVLGRTLGNYIIMLTLVATLGWIFDKNFSKDSKFTIMIMVIVSTLVFELGCYILNIITLNINIEVLQFIRIIAIEILFNALLTIILYPIMKKIGYKIEDIFKQQNILTRYY